MPVFFYSKPMIFNVIGGFLILSCHVGQYTFLWFITVKLYNFTVNNYKVGIYFTMFHKCKTPCGLKTGGLGDLCVFYICCRRCFWLVLMSKFIETASAVFGLHGLYKFYTKSNQYITSIAARKIRHTIVNHLVYAWRKCA